MCSKSRKRTNCDIERTSAVAVNAIIQSANTPQFGFWQFVFLSSPMLRSKWNYTITDEKREFSMFRKKKNCDHVLVIEE